MEIRATVAAGKLTCFGGKREPQERPLRAVLRECREELSWEPAAPPRRAVDLYVDGAISPELRLSSTRSPRAR